MLSPFLKSNFSLLNIYDYWISMIILRVKCRQWWNGCKCHQIFILHQMHYKALIHVYFSGNFFGLFYTLCVVLCADVKFHIHLPFYYLIYFLVTIYITCVLNFNEVGALWCSGSCSRLVIRGSWVRIPLGAYALRQGILSTIVSRDPGVVNGYPAGIYSFKCTVRH